MTVPLRVASALRTILSRIRSFLRTSRHFHIREHNVQSLRDLVDLIDRFLEGNVQYPLEWDDFISWSNRDPQIEKIRRRLEVAEAFLYSRAPAEQTVYVGMLIEERNRIAALIGLPPRTFEAVSRPAVETRDNSKP